MSDAPSPQELRAQRDALDLQIAQADAPQLQAVVDILTGKEAAALRDALSLAGADLPPGPPKMAVTTLLTAWGSAQVQLQMEISSKQAFIATAKAQAAPRAQMPAPIAS